eukprot:Blabericola_migrator_1__3836@NODE_2155_length_3193_cov_20_869162_g1362_i0_p1_GENE_NODE_2155_length_3193_cov_20_869162_g1362_i0NODE_2155_length_3193_cov_20_869162_g1362_i0_p1_ORF_typecomplete_len328_score35_79Galactosyl_T/PF01762_21/2_3e35Fringe/PF02434_16/9_2e07_NODE_2155_length_3193_cov_20_869162_g1362_i01631146
MLGRKLLVTIFTLWTASALAPPYLRTLRNGYDRSREDGNPIPRFIITPRNECTSETIITAAVLTIPSAVALRQKLRELHNELGGKRVRVIFPVGHSTATIDGEDVDDILRDEAEKYGDILMADYQDAYAQLCRKVMSAMVWFNRERCKPRYFMKLDDDQVVNWKALLMWLDYIDRHGFREWDQKVVNTATGPVWAGRRWDGMPVLHNPKARNYEDYDRDFYPPYLSGPTYIMNRVMTNTIEKLRRAHTRYYLNDDALMGILMEPLGVEPTNNRKFITLDGDDHRLYGCGKKASSVSQCGCEDWFAHPAPRDRQGEPIQAARNCQRQE